MYISGIDYESVADGEGVRTTLFFSGCRWNCPGCHNPESQSFHYGKPFTPAMAEDIIRYIRSASYIRGITLSGGDPMFMADELVPLVKHFREALPGINIWCYTGFCYNGVIKDKKRLALLQLVDVLVDGRFLLEQRDITLPFRGSRNQRIIDVVKSLQRGKAVPYVVG